MATRAGRGERSVTFLVNDVRAGDVLRVAPEVGRTFEGGGDGLELIAIGGPKPEGGDGERVELVWPG